MGGRNIKFGSRTEDEYQEYMNTRRKRSIYKVPEHLISNENIKAYKPQVVSIGPYHHGDKKLKEMEEHKSHAFHKFIKRSGKNIEQYLEALSSIVNDLKNAYDELDRTMWCEEGNGRFLQMMLRDGCFILEILYVHANLDDYERDDPVFSHHGILNKIPLIKRDLMLLENQVPLRVLQILVAVKEDLDITTCKDDLIKEIHNLFGLYHLPITESIKGLHILDVYRKAHLVEPMESIEEPQFTLANRILNIPSAMELHEAGMQFKRSETESLKDISFSGNTLCCPHIEVDIDTELIFLNLMAFERSHVDAGMDVSSYVFCMSCLMKSGKDISLLRSLDIVHHNLSNDENVAQLFSSLSKGAVLDQRSRLGMVYFHLFTTMRARFMERLNG